MSMICNLARVTAQQLAQLRATPEVIVAFLHPDVGEPRPQESGDVRSRPFRRSAPTASPASPSVGSLQQDDHVDLDKAWHTLHFLLAGSAWEGEFPQGFLVANGDPIGAVDVGYGPARAFSVEQTAKISDYLDTIDAATLRASLDPQKLADADIYPGFDPGFDPASVYPGFDPSLVIPGFDPRERLQIGVVRRERETKRPPGAVSGGGPRPVPNPATPRHSGSRHPQGCDAGGLISDINWAYIRGNFETARDFVRVTKERGMALLVYLN